MSYDQPIPSVTTTLEGPLDDTWTHVATRTSADDALPTVTVWEKVPQSDEWRLSTALAVRATPGHIEARGIGQASYLITVTGRGVMEA